MSDTGEGQEEEAWSGEKDELIPRRGPNLHQTDEHDGGDDQIPRGKRKQQQKSGKSSDENDNKGGSKGNRWKINKGKAEQMLLSSAGIVRKHLEGTKNTATETRFRRSAAPFPYDGQDFGGRPSRYLCFRRSSFPPASDSPRKELGIAGSDESSFAIDTAKPKHSSHYYFVKNLIENNKFYSPECNPHREVRGSQAK